MDKIWEKSSVTLPSYTHNHQFSVNFSKSFSTIIPPTFITIIMLLKSVLPLVIVGVLVLILNVAAQSNQMAAQWAGAATSGQVGKPQFHINGGGAGNNARNWGAHGNIGAGVKAWESQNRRHSIGVGANVGQSFGRFQGQSWRGRPDVGVGAAYSYRFGRRGRR